MNRFSYSLTLSLLCGTVAVSPSLAQQVIPTEVSHQEENLVQIADEQDLPIALLEDNEAFDIEVQEHPVSSETPENVIPVTKGTQSPEEVPTNEVSEPEETIPHAVETQTSGDTPSADVPTNEEIANAAEPLPIPLESTLPPKENNAKQDTQPNEIPTSEPQTEETQPEPDTSASEVSSLAPAEQTVAQTDEPQVVESDKAEPATPAAEPQNTAVQPQVPVPAQIPVSAPLPQPRPENSAPVIQHKSSAFSLNERAPIPSKLFGDNGFAPSMMDKKISISPEQRAQMMMRKKYDEMDFNKDGVVSENEFITYKTEEARKISREIFSHVDINKDGIISEDEYEVLMKKMIKSFMKQPSAMPGGGNGSAGGGIF